MARRRSDNPLQILILGVFTIGGFAALLVWLTGQTPVLRLRPVLERELGLEEVETRFVPDPDGVGASLAVILPADYPLEVEPARQIAATALQRYLDLAERTRVLRCWVASAKAPDEPVVTVTRQALSNLRWAQQEARRLPRQLASVGIRNAEVQAVGASATGAVLELSGQAASGDAGRQAVERAMERLTRLPYAGTIRAMIHTPSGIIRRTAGRDVPAAPEKPAPPAPEKPPPPAPKRPGSAPAPGGGSEEPGK